MPRSGQPNGDDATRDAVAREAAARGIRGRSAMHKAQLEAALRR